MHRKLEILMIACLLVSSFFLARAGAAFVSAKKQNPVNPVLYWMPDTAAPTRGRWELMIFSKKI